MFLTNCIGRFFWSTTLPDFHKRKKFNCKGSYDENNKNLKSDKIKFSFVPLSVNSKTPKHKLYWPYPCTCIMEMSSSANDRMHVTDWLDRLEMWNTSAETQSSVVYKEPCVGAWPALKPLDPRLESSAEPVSMIWVRSEFWWYLTTGMLKLFQLVCRNMIVGQRPEQTLTYDTMTVTWPTMLRSCKKIIIIRDAVYLIQFFFFFHY